MIVIEMIVWLKKRYFFEKTVVTYMAIKTMLEYYKYFLTTSFNKLLLRYSKLNNQFLKIIFENYSAYQNQFIVKFS